MVVKGEVGAVQVEDMRGNAVRFRLEFNVTDEEGKAVRQVTFEHSEPRGPRAFIGAVSALRDKCAHLLAEVRADVAVAEEFSGVRAAVAEAVSAL